MTQVVFAWHNSIQLITQAKNIRPWIDHDSILSCTYVRDCFSLFVPKSPFRSLIRSNVTYSIQIAFHLAYDSEGFPGKWLNSTHDSSAFRRNWFDSTHYSRDFWKYWFESTYGSSWKPIDSNQLVVKQKHNSIRIHLSRAWQGYFHNTTDRGAIFCPPPLELRNYRSNFQNSNGVR